MKNLQIMVCPSFEAIANDTTSSGSYAANLYGGMGLDSRMLGDFTDPANTFWVADRWENHPWILRYHGAGYSWPASPDKPWRESNLEDRHNGGMNCGFVDGHAKWMRPGPLISTDYYWKVVK